MIPTIWSLFFGDDEMPPEMARRLKENGKMNALRNELRTAVDTPYALSAEKAVGDALRNALDLPLTDVFLPVWRTHPALPSAVQEQHDEETLVLFGLGEHEVISTHRPRVDVLGRAAMLASFQFDLRLELMVQNATLEIDRSCKVSRVAIGACSGVGSLSLGELELASFMNEDIRFPDEMGLEARLFPEPSAGPYEDHSEPQRKRLGLFGALRRS